MPIPSPLLALPLLLAAAPAPPLLPGQWEHSVVFALDTVNGSDEIASRMQSLIPTPPPERDCYNAAELADPSRFLLDGTDRRCRFSKLDMADGRISAAGDCTDAGRTMHVEGSGSYTSTGYDFTFAGTGEANGLAMTFRGRDSGRRVGLCPAGA